MEKPEISLIIESINPRWSDRQVSTHPSIYAALGVARSQLEQELETTDWQYAPSEKTAREQAIEALDEAIENAESTGDGRPWTGLLEHFVTGGAFEFHVGDPTYEPVRYRIEVAS